MKNIIEIQTTQAGEKISLEIKSFPDPHGSGSRTLPNLLINKSAKMHK